MAIHNDLNVFVDHFKYQDFLEWTEIKIDSMGEYLQLNDGKFTEISLKDVLDVQID